MTSPRHLDTTICPYSYHLPAAITDVETGGVGIITNLRAYLVALGWTEPSTALFKSPSDDGGHWMDILVTRISATEIEFRVRDHKVHTIITRRIDIDGAGTVITYYTGKFFCRVDSLRATSEPFWAEMLETAPDLVEWVPDVVFAGAYRNNSGAADNFTSNVGYGYMWETETAAATLRQDRGYNASCDEGGSARGLLNGDGSPLYQDFGIANMGSVSQMRQVGRLYHAVLCDSSLTLQSDKPVPVDDNTTATFRVFGLATTSSCRLMYRKSDP